MLITLNRTAKRMGAMAIVVVAWLLVTGCSKDRATHSTAGQSVRDATAAGQVAALEEVTLSVPGMNCPMCPITVRRALINVDGVAEADADASLKTKEAHVRFDPALTDVDQLMAALESSGFSATIKE